MNTLTTPDTTYTMPAFNRNVCEARCNHPGCDWYSVGLAWLVLDRVQLHVAEHRTTDVQA